MLKLFTEHYNIMNKLVLRQQGSKGKRYLRKLKNQRRCY